MVVARDDNNASIIKNKPFSAKSGSAVSYLGLGKGGKVIVCAVTLVAFLFNIVSYDLAWAAPNHSLRSGLGQARTPLELSGDGSNRAGGPSVSDKIKELNTDTFRLPEYLGNIKDSWQASG